MTAKTTDNSDAFRRRVAPLRFPLASFRSGFAAQPVWPRAARNEIAPLLDRLRLFRYPIVRSQRSSPSSESRSRPLEVVMPHVRLAAAFALFGVLCTCFAPSVGPTAHAAAATIEYSVRGHRFKLAGRAITALAGDTVQIHVSGKAIPLRVARRPESPASDSPNPLVFVPDSLPAITDLSPFQVPTGDTSVSSHIPLPPLQARYELRLTAGARPDTLVVNLKDPRMATWVFAANAALLALTALLVLALLLWDRPPSLLRMPSAFRNKSKEHFDTGAVRFALVPLVLGLSMWSAQYFWMVSDYYIQFEDWFNVLTSALENTPFIFAGCYLLRLRRNQRIHRLLPSPQQLGMEKGKLDWLGLAPVTGSAVLVLIVVLAVTWSKETRLLDQYEVILGFTGMAILGAGMARELNRVEIDLISISVGASVIGYAFLQLFMLVSGVPLLLALVALLLKSLLLVALVSFWVLIDKVLAERARFENTVLKVPSKEEEAWRYLFDAIRGDSEVYIWHPGCDPPIGLFDAEGWHELTEPGWQSEHASYVHAMAVTLLDEFAQKLGVTPSAGVRKPATRASCRGPICWHVRALKSASHSARGPRTVLNLWHFMQLVHPECASGVGVEEASEWEVVLLDLPVEPLCYSLARSFPQAGLRMGRVALGGESPRLEITLEGPVLTSMSIVMALAENPTPPSRASWGLRYGLFTLRNHVLKPPAFRYIGAPEDRRVAVTLFYGFTIRGYRV